MNILITGGSGFLGGNLLAEILSSPHYDDYTITVIDKNYYVPFSHRVKSYKVDIENQVLPVELFTQKFDLIFHFASPCSIIQYKKEPNCHERAVIGFNRIKELANIIGAKLVIPSTGSLSAEKLNEYALTKKYFEENISEDDYCFRIYAAYGDEESKGEYASVIYQFCKAAYNNEEIVIYGDGNQKRDFIYVRDVASIMLSHISYGVRSGDIASFQQISFNEIITVIEKVLGRKCNVKYIEKPEGYLNETKASKQSLTSYGLTTLEEGITKILGSFSSKPKNSSWQIFASDEDCEEFIIKSHLDRGYCHKTFFKKQVGGQSLVLVHLTYSF